MKLIHKIVYFILIATATSCSYDGGDAPNLKASFSYQPDEVLVGTTINFTNNSEETTESTLYSWDFGDGSSTTTKNPSHTYTEVGDGSYNVILALKDGSREVMSQEQLTVSLSNTISGRLSLIDKLSDTKILTCAHRSNNGELPENSISAINKAIAEGIAMVEIDIRKTRDGELVLMHDATIDRTTDGTGNVSDYTLQDIQKFKLYSDNGVLSNEKVPSLKEVLAVARGKVYIDLDISNKVSFETIYPIVKQFGMLKQVLFYSSKLDVIKTMLNKDPEVIAMPIIDGDSRFSDYENLQNIKVVHYTNDSFNQTLVNKAKAKGWYIFMNAYVNTNTTPDDDNYSQVDKVSILSGNIIQTDYPVLVKKHLNN